MFLVMTMTSSILYSTVSMLSSFVMDSSTLTSIKRLEELLDHVLALVNLELAVYWNK